MTPTRAEFRAVWTRLWGWPRFNRGNLKQDYETTLLRTLATTLPSRDYDSLKRFCRRLNLDSVGRGPNRFLQAALTLTEDLFMNHAKYQAALDEIISIANDLKTIDANLLAELDEDQVTILKDAVITARNFFRHAHKLFDWDD